MTADSERRVPAAARLVSAYPRLSIALTVAVVAALVRLPWLASAPPGFALAEARAALHARAAGLDRAALLPHVEGPTTFEPLFTWVMRATAGLAGWDVAGARGAAALLGIVASVATALWLARLARAGDWPAACWRRPPSRRCSSAAARTRPSAPPPAPRSPSGASGKGRRNARDRDVTIVGTWLSPVRARRRRVETMRRRRAPQRPRKGPLNLNPLSGRRLTILRCRSG